jgi:hypothetical protein
MMPSIAEKLTAAIQYLAMHIAEASSGMINKIGVVSVTSGLTNGGITAIIEPQSQGWITLSQAGMTVSAVGGIMFIIKVIVDIYYARKKDKREQQAHDART